MSRKEESITLSVSPSDKEELEALALKHNCLWGNKPNISKLIQQIAIGRLKIVVSASKESEIKSLLRSPEVRRLYELLKEQDQNLKSFNELLIDL